MNRYEEEVFLVKEIFFFYESPADIVHHFLGFYVPLRNVSVENVLIEDLSETKEREKMLTLLDQPCIVFDPRIVDDRVQKFVQIVEERISGFTFGEIFEKFKPILLKALEFGNGLAFQLLYSWRLLHKNTTSIAVFFTRPPRNVFEDKIASSIIRCCAEFDLGDLLLLFVQKFNHRQLFSKDLKLKIPTVREEILLKKLFSK